MPVIDVPKPAWLSEDVELVRDEECMDDGIVTAQTALMVDFVPRDFS